MNTSLIVQNLKCDGCARAITVKLSVDENISDLYVDVENSTISFGFKETKDISSVKEKLKSMGYPSIDENNSMMDKAMSFMSCATGKMSKQ